MDFPITTKPRNAFEPELLAVIDADLVAAQAQDQPFILHMLGVPGAGKTTFAEQLLMGLADYQPSYVDFDHIMKRLPAYQARADQDLVAAFTQFELPAREGGYFLVKSLLDKRANLVFDHGGSPNEHVELLQYAKFLGYRNFICHIDIDPDEAKARNKMREQVTKRHTPPHYVDERLVKIHNLVQRYKAVADVYQYVDNSGQSQPEQTAPFLKAIKQQLAGVLLPIVLAALGGARF